MKFSPEPLKRGDMVRVMIGTVYHYGIYVSDEEVIQFGYPPIPGESRDSARISLFVSPASFRRRILVVATASFSSSASRALHSLLRAIFVFRGKQKG